jgi:sulfur-carrier protein adenylyltransferase/sulfurtransferase
VNTLSPKELLHYSRHLSLKEFGAEGQQKLNAAKVLVVGAGGLGCPALLYLTAAGIGKIGFVDFDTVHESNLHRQVLFTVNDIGKNKAEVARVRLTELNPFIALEPIPFQLNSGNALGIIEPYDVVIDGSDNFPTRYLVNDACVLLNKPLIYGSVLEFEGQVAVFNMLTSTGHSVNYRDVFHHPPLPGQVPNCASAGVLGVLPGIIGSLQALEAIKLISGKGNLLINQLLLLDGLSMEFTTVQLKNTNSRLAIKELIDYEVFCGINEKNNKSLGMKEITVQELLQLKDSGEDFQLIDVREEYEYDTGNLQGELIPLSQIPHSLDKISKDKKVIIHCRSGSRSAQAVMWIEKNHPFENLFNLKGGIVAWAKEIDPTIEV